MTRADPDEVPWLMIYGQEYEHDDLHIVGTEAGLTRLRDAIGKALASNKALSNRRAYEEMIAPDGEGYEVTVQVCRLPELGKMPPHYDRRR